MDNDNYGWEVSILDHICQGQFQVVDSPQITFGDPLGLLEAFVTVPMPNTNPQQFQTFDLGQLPATFRELEMKSITTLNGVEAMRQYRAPRLHNGGYFEVSYGARFFQIDDAFSVKGFGNFFGQLVGTALGTGFTFPLNIMDQSTWGTRVQDNLVGAQIGLRWFRQQGHWLTSVEGRFMAAANFENVSQVTSLGTRANLNIRTNQSSNATELFSGLGTKTHENSTVFSPMGELRLNVSYVVTSNVNLKVGYNGLVVGNVSRASDRVDYNSPNLVGISPKSNNEIFFVNGLSFGVEVNR